MEVIDKRNVHYEQEDHVTDIAAGLLSALPAADGMQDAASPAAG
jgi:hypothetical protein